MSLSENIRYQLKQNLLAVISIIVAISALSYNTWRNERSEENRNYRTAGFEILRESARLQLLVDTATYSDKKENVEVIQGWVQVNLILSLSEIMPIAVKKRAIFLKQEWSKHWSLIIIDEESNNRVSQANYQLVSEVRLSLSRLN